MYHTQQMKIWLFHKKSPEDSNWQSHTLRLSLNARPPRTICFSRSCSHCTYTHDSSPIERIFKYSSDTTIFRQITKQLDFYFRKKKTIIQSLVIQVNSFKFLWITVTKICHGHLTYLLQETAKPLTLLVPLNCMALYLLITYTNLHL